MTIVVLFATFQTSCRKPNAKYERMKALKTQLQVLKDKNKELEDLFYTVSKSRQRQIEKKIVLNEKKIEKLQKSLSKYTAGRQKGVLNAINDEMNAR
jgi:predicted  nucleic acid-binding Zn-ribbon protein